MPRIVRWLVKCLLAGAAAISTAAYSEVLPGSQPLIAHGDPVVLPGVGRILLAFVLTVAVAVGAIYALRRFLAKLPGYRETANSPSSNVRVHTTLHRGLRLHVVEVQGRTVLLAEGKNGMAMTVISTDSADQQIK